MLLVVLLAIIAIVAATYSPSYAMFQGEIYGAWLSAVMAVCLAGLYVYIWAFGRKVRWESFSAAE